jgi:hypothetical protein
MATTQGSSPGTRLAHRIARNAAAGTIEGVCPEKRIGRSKWFKADVGVDRIDKADVALAVSYLESQGMLERNRSDANLVRVRRSRQSES